MDSTPMDASILQQLSLPTRRDYQLRSYSVKAFEKRCGPRASGLPSQAPKFHVHQDEIPLEKSCSSGPIFSNISTDKVNIVNASTSFHRRQWSEGSLPGTSELGSSPGASFREEEHHQFGGQFYIQAGDENQAPNMANTFTPPIYSPYDTNSVRIAKPRQSWSSRNCVSGDLSMGYNLPPAERFKPSRRCVSGQLDSSQTVSGSVGYHGSKSKSGAEAQEEKLVKVTNDTKPRPSASGSWNVLNESRLDGPVRGKFIAAIPYEWEEASGKPREFSKKELLRASSFQSEKSEQASALGESSFRSSRRYYGLPNKKDFDLQSESGKWEEGGTSDLNLVAPGAAKFLKDVAPAQSSPAKVVPVAVPFKWEEVPGKPKVKGTSVSDVTPSLQLPPRLASTSQKHEKASNRKALVARVYPTNRSMSGPVAVLYPEGEEFDLPTRKGAKQSSRKEDVRMCSSTHFSGPLDIPRQGKHLQAWRGSSGAFSGPVSNSLPSHGLSHYHQGVEICDSGEACGDMEQTGRPPNAACSPTSILSGPMSDGRTSYSTSSPMSDINIHSNALYNSHSNSQSSTSRESFDHWSSGDHTTPMSRLPANVQVESRHIIGSPYIGPTPDDNSNKSNGGAIRKLRRAGSQWKKSRSKSSKGAVARSREWPANLVTYPTFVTSPQSFDLDGCSSYGDTFYDCHGSRSSSPLPHHNVRTELSSSVTRTRLPCTMPSVVEPDPDDPNLSTRNLTEFSNCLGVPITLPRFLSRCEIVADVDPYFWVENPSWAPPSSYLEDGYRSPAYQATLELLSPSQELMTRTRGSRRSHILKLSSSSLRKAQIVEVVCHSLKEMLLKYARRSH